MTVNVLLEQQTHSRPVLNGLKNLLCNVGSKWHQVLDPT